MMPLTISPFSLEETDADAPIPEQSVIDALDPWHGLWRGLVFGESTVYHLSESIGLFEYESRVSDEPIPQGDGDILFGRWASGRYVTLTFAIAGVPGTLVNSQNVDRWVAAFSARGPYAQDWLVFATAHRKVMMRARVTRRSVDISPFSARTGRTNAVVELKLADPRLYIAWPLAQRSQIIAIGVAVGGGFDLPSDLPFDMTAGAGGATTISNNGSATAYPVLRIYNAGPSPITSATVTNTTTGVVFEIDSTITAGQTLVADFDAMQRAEPGPVIHVDESSRYADWQHPRIPLALVPGANVFTADVTGGTPTVRLDWIESVL